MLGVGHGQRVERRGGWLAALFCTLIALASAADQIARAGRVDLIRLEAADLFVAGAAEAAPMIELRPGQPSALAVLVRPPAVESGLGRSAGKTPLLALRAEQDFPPVPAATSTPRPPALRAFWRSSVGSARTPTGPPHPIFRT